MLRSILYVTAIVAMVTAAPVQEAAKQASGAETPLLREKRSQEVIMFGNKQNVDGGAVVKKSGWEDAIDQNARIESDTGAAEDMAGNPDIKDVSSSLDAGDLTVAELLGDQMDQTKDQEEGGENEEEKIKDELEGLVQEQQAEDELEQGNQNPENEPNLDESQLLAEDGNDVDALPEYNADDLLQYYYNRKYPGDYGMSDPYRKKRSTADMRAFTAEGMTDMSTGGAKASMRVKRDLTADDIEALLAMENLRDEEYQNEAYNALEEDPEEALWEDQLEEAYYPNEVEEFGQETAFPVSDEELERAKERLELLSYLEDNPELLEDLREEYAEPYGVAEEVVEEFPGGDLERYEEMLEAEEEPEQQQVEYRSIMYEGQPGIFIPVKRQYISMVPGVRKRDFYPYIDEPQGHWGAFVPEQEKRSEEEAYERLYRLAQALRSEDDYRKK